ncbi:hypothetical protein KIW84_071620 [Lathyrus oleraceus]|uniref:Uncharacterized protein n=1 Tax=Pisum sativum TaxID=3888 RepID=A0A9D4VJY9_PEA|nr:hypothetical protein KIW84_071620 [Pisum sativum]
MKQQWQVLNSHAANNVPTSTIAMVQQQQHQVAQIAPYPHPTNGNYVLMPRGGSHLNANNLKYGVQQFKPVPAGNPTGFGNFANPAGYAMLAPGVVGGASGLEDSSRVKYKDNLYVPNLQIALGGATGICYLHHECSPPVIHSSILFDEDCEAKIVTHGYIAPELDEAAVASYNVTCCHSKLNQAPTATNYDVGSTTWVDLRIAPLLSAMEVTLLGHGPSRSTIDPIQIDGAKRVGYERVELDL